MIKKQLRRGAIFLLTLAFTSCMKKDLSAPTGVGFVEKHSKGSKNSSIHFYALDANNTLIKYSGNQTFREESNISITGMQAGEMMLAIDYRPATGQLYAVSNQSRIYMINEGTGMATAVSSVPFTPYISGSEVGFDFNPTVDRIRLVTSNRQNLRLNPATGAVAATDGSLNPGSPSIVACAYTNSFAGSSSTSLYDIDVAMDKLFIQNPPNAGNLIEVGPLGINAEGEGGFDITPDNTIALAALYANGDDEEVEGVNGFHLRFYYINLQTGEAKNAGKANRQIIGLAIPAQ